MLSLSTSWAITLRHLRLFKRDVNHILGTLYWPLLDIFIWGYLGIWIQQSQCANFHNYELTALLGVLLWQVVGRGSNGIIFSLAEELWSNNIINLFSLPLRTIEWVMGIILYYAIMTTITAFFCIVISHMLYSIPLWQLIATFLMFLPPLFFSGLWVGFTCLQIVAIFGRRGTELGFVMGWILMPFSGAYYPIDILPQWGQQISTLLPMSYVFKGMRHYLMYQQNPMPYLIKGYILSTTYATIAIILFIHCINRSKKRGLAKLAE